MCNTPGISMHSSLGSRLLAMSIMIPPLFQPSVEVDVMPGAGDPASQLLPQQPMHVCCFPRASSHGRMLNTVTNPYSFHVHDVHIVGTSGQNISDLIRCSVEGGALDRLGDLLLWQHLGPTIPDTVDGFPFRDRDPMVLDSVPHVLFAGNQQRGEHRILRMDNGAQCLLLSVPRFHSQAIAQIVNLNTLHVTYHDFSL